MGPLPGNPNPRPSKCYMRCSAKNTRTVRVVGLSGVAEDVPVKSYETVTAFLRGVERGLPEMFRDEPYSSSHDGFNGIWDIVDGGSKSKDFDRFQTLS